MTCNEREDLVAWRDGALSPGRSEELAAHVDTCPACAAELAKLERALAALASLPELPAPGPELRARVLAAVTAAEPSAWALATWLRAGLRPVVLFPALAAAAALLVLVPRVQPAPPTPDEVTSVLEPHGEPVQLEVALVLDELEQLETLGLESPEDAEVVAMLDELEVRP